MILEDGEKVLYWPFLNGGKNLKMNTENGFKTVKILNLEKFKEFKLKKIFGFAI